MIRRIHVSAAAIAFAAAALYAQQTLAPAANGGRGAGRGPMIPAIEETGFQPIFDGKSLAGWDGDPKFWRVENGAIIGQTLTDRQPEQNTFLIWRGGSPADFELKLQFKLTGFNSGIQIRSVELPDIKYAMKGYQADMDGVAAVHRPDLRRARPRLSGDARPVLLCGRGQEARGGGLRRR